MWVCFTLGSVLRNSLSDAMTMKHFLIYLALGSILGSCLSEDSADPGTPTTWVRYYNNGYNDEAVTFEETADKGFVILANTKIKISDADPERSKIKLIRTDAMGGQIWQKSYPDFGTIDTINYKANGLFVLPNDGGYVIAGEDIQTDSTTNALFMVLDASGNITKTISTSMKAEGFRSISAKAVSINSTGDYAVLVTSGTTWVIPTIIKGDFSSTVSGKWSAGKTSLSNRIYTEGTDEIIFAGTVLKNNSTISTIRLAKIVGDDPVRITWDYPIVDDTYEITASDFTKFGDQYAFIGSTNNTSDGTKDILFRRLDPNTGNETARSSFGLEGQDDIGNSISATQDGGLILLSSINTKSLTGKDQLTDFYLIKINSFGETPEWQTYFGSRFRDTGAAVRQASDGGYVVLGTSNQGSLNILVLCKANKNGKIE